MSSQKSDNNPPTTQIITLPFPPIISAQDLIDRRSPEKVTAKTPNAFFVYRKAFVNHLQNCNHNFKMRDVSSMAGLSWKAAPREVKDAYKQIAREVERIIISQRQKRYKEYSSNNRYNPMLRPLTYLESPYQFHNPTPFFQLQSLPSMSTNDLFFTAVGDQHHLEPREEPIYDTSSQYNLLPPNIHENDQFIVPVVPSSRIVENYQQIDNSINDNSINDNSINSYDPLAFQELTQQQNFTPINSAIDQFTTDYFNEDDLILW